LAEAEKDPEAFLQEFRAARERYERRTRDETSQFWTGLNNRWDQQLSDSLSMLV
jgi:hypothetical protein